jgi:hypothetical protein
LININHAHRHHPRKRMIQYAAASRINRQRAGILDRPVKPGDDSRDVREAAQITRYPPSAITIEPVT